MWKLFNSIALRRFQGIRGLGILALSVAFGLTGLLVLSSCGDDNDEAGPEPTAMTGFYSSINQDGADDCQHERVEVYVEEGEVSIGEPNVRILAEGDVFGDATFGHVGVKVGMTDTHPETIVSAYVTADGGSFSTPGTYFLAARTDSDIAPDGETIYTGFWAGHIVRLEGNPVVICPYVLVPKGVLDEGSCGTDPADMDEGLAKYLRNADGTGRACTRLLHEGVLSFPEN